MRYKRKFDDPNAEMDGISRLLRSNRKIKRQSLMIVNALSYSAIRKRAVTN